MEPFPPLNKPFVQRKKIVLFIDTGDNCRAPMAKGYLEKLMRLRNIRHVQVNTAGVMTRNGLLPTQESVQMLSEEGEDIRSHRSKPMTAEMLENADLVLGMGAFQVQKATRTNPNAKGKTFLLKEYVGLTGRNAQISDPMGGTMEVYRKVFNEIKAAINLLIEKEFFTNPPPELLALTQPPKTTKPARLTGPDSAGDAPAPAKAKSEKSKTEKPAPARKAPAEKSSKPAKSATTEVTSAANKPAPKTAAKAPATAPTAKKATTTKTKVAAKAEPAPAKKATDQKASPAKPTKKTPAKAAPAKDKEAPSKDKPEGGTVKTATKAKSKPTGKK
jgi:protein-tyrosine phosphatase